MEPQAPLAKILSPDDHRRLARALGLYVLKDKLNPEEVAAKLPSLELLAYPEGAEIVREGAEGSELYVISRGSAAVVRGGKQIARLAAGDMFGEVAFLSTSPSSAAGSPSRQRNATVRAGEGCEVFRCEAKGFADIVSQHPALLESMLGLAARRQKTTS